MAISPMNDGFPDVPSTGDGKLYVMFVNVGQGDCTAIIGPDGSRILIDCGSTELPANGGLDLVKLELGNFLESRYIHLMVMSHPDGDHFNLFKKIVEDRQVFSVYYGGEFSSNKGEVYSKNQEFKNWWYYEAKLEPIGEPTNVNFRDPVPRLMLDGGGASFWAIASNVDTTGTPGFQNNTHSLVVRADFGNDSFIILGDATCPTEDFMLANMAIPNAGLRAKIARVGHHGSATSSAQRFITALNGLEMAIISVGKKKYPLPKMTVVKRWLPHVGASTQHEISYYEDDLTECDKKLEEALSPRDDGEALVDPVTVQIARAVYSTYNAGSMGFILDGT